MAECGKGAMEKLFERCKGHPVEIFTTDGVRYNGITLSSDSECVEVIEEGCRIVFIPFKHIDAIVEPRMRLAPFCGEGAEPHRKEEERCEKEHGRG